MKKILVIVTDHNNYASADCKYEEWLNKALHFEGEEGVVFVATHIQLLRLRLAHKKGELLITKIMYDGAEIMVDKDGQLSDYPNGFFDEFETLLDQLLDWNLEKDEW